MKPTELPEISKTAGLVFPRSLANRAWTPLREETFHRFFGKYKGTKCQYLEIGVFEGASACWMLKNIMTHVDAVTFLLDRVFTDTLRGNLEQFPNSKISMVEGDSNLSLRTLINDRMDMIYIDGNHDCKYVLTDAVLSWDILKPEGIVIFDDYELPALEKYNYGRPKEAIDSFLTCFDKYIKVLHKGRQVVIKKR